MNVLPGLAQREDHLHLWKKRLRIAIVAAGIKYEPVHARHDLETVGQLRQSPLRIGMAGCDAHPFAPLLNRKHNRHARCRLSGCCIENVGGNHAVMSLFSRRSVIFRCSSAAICSSSAGSWCRRSSRVVTISSLDLSVAHTMKV